MTDGIVVLKVFLIFIFMVFLLRKKLSIGFVMFIAAFLLGIIFKKSPLALFERFFYTIKEPYVIKTLLIVGFITTIGTMLKGRGHLDNMSKYIGCIFPDRRFAIAVLPAIIGLLPMPGGALFSAPMVEGASSGLNIPPEEKSFYNFWFRHVWEYTLPIYPGLILASALIGVAVPTIILKQFPFTFFAILGGILLLYLIGTKLEKTKVNKDRLKENIWGLILSLWPIILILTLIFIFKVDILYSLGITIVLFAIFYKFRFGEFLDAFKKGFSINLILLILGIFYFKDLLEVTNSAKSFPNFFVSLHINNLVIVMVLPFFIGLLTGITHGFVGVTFPVLSSIFTVNGIVNMDYVALAFLFGFIGVLLSPFHLCLVLTKEYFKADFAKIYRLLMGPAIFLGITGFVYITLL